MMAYTLGPPMNNLILNAYKGEIYGMSFFQHFANHYSDTSHKQLWDTLLEVEKLTATLLEPFIQQHFQSSSVDTYSLQLNGVRDAEKWINLPWPQLIDTLVDWVEPYEEKYRAWASEAVVEIEVFKLIADHETAILQCLRAKQQGGSGIQYLASFLNSYSMT